MDDLGFGLQTTVIGMGLVFGLLALLWGLLSLAARLEPTAEEPPAGVEPGVLAVQALPTPQPAAELPAMNISAPPGLDPRLVAAIAIAVVRHAEERRRQAAPAMRSYWPGSLLYASRWVASGRSRQNKSWRRGR